jgi:hypothetical protein
MSMRTLRIAVFSSAWAFAGDQMVGGRADEQGRDRQVDQFDAVAAARRGMPGAHWTLREAARPDRRDQFVRVGVDLAEAGLDADFSDRGRRYEDALGALDHLAGGHAQARAAMTTHRWTWVSSSRRISRLRIRPARR